MKRSLLERIEAHGNRWLGAGRTALLLYSVLVVLPTAVFGGLHWHEILTSYRTQQDAVPTTVEDAANRVLAGVRETVERLIEAEEERPWTHYREEYYVPGRGGEGVPFLPSPLATQPRPEGLVAWFAYNHQDGADADVLLLAGEATADPDQAELHARLAELVSDLIRREGQERIEIIEGLRLQSFRVGEMPLAQVAVNLSDVRDPVRLERDLASLGELAERPLELHTWEFHLRLVRDARGRPWLYVARRVRILSPFTAEYPDCFLENGYGGIFIQGFFLDAEWFLEEMPAAVAAARLTAPLRFLGPGSRPAAEEEYVRGFDLLETFDVELDLERDRRLGEVRVALDTSEIDQRFLRTSTRFLGVAVMMIVSLSLGMWMLVRRLSSSLEQARRTENFVAAVTHELRTPIAAVKMYGEMLQDGWIRDPEKQADYLARILRETDRLDGLVDRVLEKRRLASARPVPAPGDLNAAVEAEVPSLMLSAGTFGGDLAFELAPDLPPVLLLPEAVQAILVNLVENARKYAPVGAGDPAAEPIRVITRLHRGRVVLEVADRGPGIPEAERSKVFEAFYRIGDERTRRTRGTGLGLHLVQLQAQAMRARVQVQERPGGGALFRVVFRSA